MQPNSRICDDVERGGHVSPEEIGNLANVSLIRQESFGQKREVSLDPIECGVGRIRMFLRASQRDLAFRDAGADPLQKLVAPRMNVNREDEAVSV